MGGGASLLRGGDTTPPVMKMYFGVPRSVMILLARCRRGQQSPDLFEILRRIDAKRFVPGFDRLDADAMLQRAQLLERFRPFERRRLEGCQNQQGAPAIGVEADMSIERRPAATRVAEVRDRRP